MKVALLFICINPTYWPFVKDVIEDARKNFLPDKQVSVFLWTDMPQLGSPEMQAVLAAHKTNAEILAIRTSLEERSKQTLTPEQAEQVQIEMSELNKLFSRETQEEVITYIRNSTDIEIFPTDPVTWPMGTLFRYHLFLQQEEHFKDYDYLFYCDADMRMVDVINDEILGDGLTAALHPMYAFRPGLRFPLEPNPASAAYIKVPKYYYAGGFQGGKAKAFIDAWKEMKKTIDYDFARNYVAIWNDESHWNRYLVDHMPAIICSPSYIYPDSLIDTYYKPLWGENYPPKIITLTKKATTTRIAGAAVGQVITDLSKMKQ